MDYYSEDVETNENESSDQRLSFKIPYKVNTGIHPVIHLEIFEKFEKEDGTGILAPTGVLGTPPDDAQAPDVNQEGDIYAPANYFIMTVRGSVEVVF
jgi:hypothetical protein